MTLIIRNETMQKDFANESEVKKWCTKNVKLERIKSDPNNTLRGREF